MHVFFMQIGFTAFNKISADNFALLHFFRYSQWANYKSVTRQLCKESLFSKLQVTQSPPWNQVSLFNATNVNLQTKFRFWMSYYKIWYTRRVFFSFRFIYGSCTKAVWRNSPCFYFDSRFKAFLIKKIHILKHFFLALSKLFFL